MPFGFGFRHNFLWGGSGSGLNELLDVPSNNFDIAGVPRGGWSSGFFCCLQNIVPSCILATFCPCMMWAQIVVRSQIPLLIGTKNSFTSLRHTSGYNCFMNFYLILLAISAGFFVAAFFIENEGVKILFFGVFAFFFLIFLFVNGHVRTAFKLKYEIPIDLPRGCIFWDCLGDAIVSCICWPCALSQMARHVFQYDRWNPPIGMYIHDPYSLDPLEAMETRPALADNAGLIWGNDDRHPNAVDHRGNADRIREQQQAQQAQQAQHFGAGNLSANPVVAVAVYPASGGNQRSAAVYDMNGKMV